jgi:hypothetical protein
VRLSWLLPLLLAAGCPYCDIAAIPCEGDDNCPTGSVCHGSFCCDGSSPCECQQLRACDAFLADRAGFTASELAGVDPSCSEPACAADCVSALVTAQNLIEGPDLGPCEPLEE